MVDIHTHILPGIDDGSKDMIQTLEMLKIAYENGIDKIVCTSHFYRGYYENRYDDICDLIKKVKIEKEKHDIKVNIFPGQEIFLDKNILEDYKNGIVSGINGTKYTLVELPMQTMPYYALDLLYELRLLGAVPILAHPERYVYFIEKPSIINDFLEEEILFQINSGSIIGVFGKRVQELSKILLEHNICDFIASDAHSTGRRSPKIKEALTETDNIGKEISQIVMSNADSVIQGLDIKSRHEKIRKKRSIFSFLKRE